MKNALIALVFFGLLLLANHHGASISEREHESLARQYQFCIHHYGPGPALHRCLAGQNRRGK